MIQNYFVCKSQFIWILSKNKKIFLSILEGGERDREIQGEREKRDEWGDKKRVEKK